MQTVPRKTLSALNMASVNVPATSLGILSVGEQGTQFVISAAEFTRNQSLRSEPKEMLVNKEEVASQGQAKDQKVQGWVEPIIEKGGRVGRSRNTTLAPHPSPNCPHFFLPLLDLVAERGEISGEEKEKEGKRKVGRRVREKKGPAHHQRIVLPQTQCAPSLGSASASATNRGSLSAGERETRCVPRKEEAEMGSVPVSLKQIVQQQTQCALSLASVSASATSRETRSVGGEGRVFVAQKVETQRRKALNKETTGIRVKSRGLVALTRIVQPRILSARNLDSASANATSLEMLSAGAKEIACVVQTKEEQPDRKEEQKDRQEEQQDRKEGQQDRKEGQQDKK